MSRIAVPLLLGLLGIGVLCSLGVWQVHRLAWKQSILAEIEAKIAAPPVPLPAAPDPAEDRFLPVQATGTITSDEIDLLVSTRDTGAAWRVVAAFETDDGRRILLDRGIVRYDDKDTPRPPVHTTVTGNLHWPMESDRFTPEPQLAENIWFARDVPAMAAALGTEPVMIVARSTTEAEPVALPLPVDTTGIPNDHLGYAITWFGLAAVWAGMTGLWIRYRLKRED